MLKAAAGPLAVAGTSRHVRETLYSTTKLTVSHVQCLCSQGGPIGTGWRRRHQAAFAGKDSLGRPAAQPADAERERRKKGAGKHRREEKPIDDARAVRNAPHEQLKQQRRAKAAAVPDCKACKGAGGAAYQNAAGPMRALLFSICSMRRSESSRSAKALRRKWQCASSG